MIEIDFETFSHIDVRDVGPQVYFRHPSTEVLMMSYAIDDGPVHLWVPDGPWEYDKFPARVKRRLLAGEELWAHNVEFEQNGLRHVLGIDVPFSQCRDTAILALRYGYPMSLAGAASAVGLEVQKDTRGKTLINKFCKPRRPSKNNPAIRWYPEAAPDEWQEFCDYCVQDTKTEQALRKRLT